VGTDDVEPGAVSRELVIPLAKRRSIAGDLLPRLFVMNPHEVLDYRPGVLLAPIDAAVTTLAGQLHEPTPVIDLTDPEVSLAVAAAHASTPASAALIVDPEQVNLGAALELHAAILEHAFS